VPAGMRGAGRPVRGRAHICFFLRLVLCLVKIRCWVTKEAMIRKLLQKSARKESSADTVKQSRERLLL
jgi:hypothetical protein